MLNWVEVEVGPVKFRGRSTVGSAAPPGVGFRTATKHPQAFEEEGQRAGEVRP